MKSLRFRWLSFLLVFVVVFEVGAFASNRLFPSQNQLLDQNPSSFEVSLKPIGLASFGPKKLRPASDRLIEAALNFHTAYRNVPYVYGGSALGSDKNCKACSNCVLKNKLKANSTFNRYKKCAACRSCGIDCSNFVNRVFSRAGLDYRFADTSTFITSEDDYINEEYGFVNMGTDLEDVKAGDIVFEKGHVVMVVNVNKTQRTLDYIHASRGKRKSKIGGIEMRKDVDWDKYQRNVLKILRHRELLDKEDEVDTFSLRSKIWGKVRQLFAVN